MKRNRVAATWRTALRCVVCVAASAVALVPATAQVLVDFSPSSLNLNLGESALVEVTVTGVPAEGLAA